jgi:UDP-N-acetylmuramate--alanine ligase
MKETGTVDMIGGSEYFAFEACEYMDSFLDFNPTVAVVLNIELDHVDYFKSIGQIRDSFTAFMNLTGEDGYAVININDKDCIMAAEGVKSRCVTFAHENPAADYYSDNETLADGYPEFDVCHHGETLAHVKLKVPGEHSVSDALAAFAACALSGIDPEIIAEGLSSYEGIGRRMDKICVTKSGAVLYSDYAHHPTEIATTLSGVDKICRGKLNVVFQPHTFSRTAELFDDFVRAFAECGADEIVLCDIYPARETNIYGVSSAALAEAIAKTGKKCIAAESFDAAAEYINSVSGTGDVILVMGAGDVIKVADAIEEKFGE